MTNIFNKEESCKYPLNTRYSVDFNGNIWDDKLNRQMKPWIRKGSDQYKSSRQGYYHVQLMTRGENKRYRAHKIHRMVAITFLPHGDIEDWVDHDDENTLNNHYTNLRWCDPSHNLANRPKWVKKKENLPKNVFRHGKKYRVSVKKDYKLKHYGSYDTVEEARQRAIVVSRDVFGEFANE